METKNKNILKDIYNSLEKAMNENFMEDDIDCEIQDKISDLYDLIENELGVNI